MCKRSQIYNRPMLCWPQFSSAQLPVRYLLYSCCPLVVYLTSTAATSHSSFVGVQDPHHRLAHQLLVSVVLGHPGKLPFPIKWQLVPLCLFRLNNVITVSCICAISRPHVHIINYKYIRLFVACSQFWQLSAAGRHSPPYCDMSYVPHPNMPCTVGAPSNETALSIDYVVPFF